jgi:hypothetical protein
MKKLWMLLAVSCATSMAAEVTLVIPQISKSDEVPADGDPLQARYEAAWAKYEQAIAKVVAQVTEALDKEFNKAADAGSLDSADKWDKKKKAFLDTLTVTVEVPDKPKRPVVKKPKADAPASFEEIREAAQQAIDSALATLKNDYENLVKDYTKERNLARAKALRDELAGLAATSGKVTDVEKSNEKTSGDVGQPKLHPARAGSERFKTHSYKVFVEKLPWHQAKARCEEMGGYLAVISDAQEEAFIRKLIAKAGLPLQPKDGVWLGATDQGQEGRWVWVDGTPMKYSNWFPNQPNNKQNAEHYLMLWLQSGQWSDQPAVSQQHDIYFVCEWDG